MIYFMNDFREYPFSLPTFQKEFSKIYHRFKPKKVVFLIEEALGGEDHLVHAMLYFERNFSPNIPFDIYIVKYEGEDKPPTIQEIQPEFQDL